MTEIEEEVEVATRIIGLVRPQDADLTASPSMKWFLKLHEIDGLVVQVKATMIERADEFYAKSNKSRAGDIKKSGGLTECVFITVTNLFDFAVQASWYGGDFKGAVIGGKRSGHRPEKLFPQITKAKEEIARCLN